MASLDSKGFRVTDEELAQHKANKFQMDFCIFERPHGARFVWFCGVGTDKVIAKFSPQPEQPKPEYTGPKRRKDDVISG